MKNTKIEWTEHTFNPWWGCEKVSPGCKLCYAEALAKRTGHKVWGGGRTPRRFFGVEHWDKPFQWNAAAEKLNVMHRVFCGSMCDIFEDRPDLTEHRTRVLGFPGLTPNLLWLFLTKRPENWEDMVPAEWLEQWPRNVILGVTIEDQERLDERMRYVRRFVDMALVTPGHIGNSPLLFASCEPLLSELEWCHVCIDNLDYFDWVIGGGESSHGARMMNPAWIRKLRDDCTTRGLASVPFLFKQWGEWVGGSCDRNEWFYPAGGPADGQAGSKQLVQIGDGVAVDRVGKKAAGRVLDGRTWDQVPLLPSGGPQLPAVIHASNPAMVRKFMAETGVSVAEVDIMSNIDLGYKFIDWLNAK